jgi:hypothetical protein
VKRPSPQSRLRLILQLQNWGAIAEFRPRVISGRLERLPLPLRLRRTKHNLLNKLQPSPK